MNSNINKAIEVFKSGGIVIFPTDTVFGIGCRIDNKKSVKRLFSIKNRDVSQAVPVLVSSTEMAKEYVHTFSQKVEHLLEAYWPGGLTVVLTCKKEKVLSLIRGSGETIGVRIPDYEGLFDVIDTLGVPIIGTSANFHGRPSVSKSVDLDKELVKKVDYVLEGESLGFQSSTVIDCSHSPWKILRQGAVKVSI